MNGIKHKIKYFVYKILAFIIPVKVLGKKIASGIIWINAGKVQKKLIFYLHDPLCIHLGDQLFWAPTVIALHSAGLPVQVTDSGTLSEFWKCNGIELVKSELVDFDHSLCFSYLSVFFSRGLSKHQVIAVDFTDPKISDRVASYLCSEVCDFLEVDLNVVPRLKLPPLQNYELLQQIKALGDSVWLFNDLLVSGFYRWTEKKRRRIWEKARELKESGGQIVYLKGANESQLPYLCPDAVTLDLRGKTTPDEVMGLLQLSNVKGTISFDNFLMHSALLCGKKAYVMFRGRFSGKQKKHCYQKVNTAFNEIDAENIHYL